MFDTHIHTTFSTDSQMGINDAIRKSKDLNIGLIITDHIDLNYYDKTKFRFDIDDYFKSYSKYISNNFLLGIELGMDFNYEKKNAEIYNNYDFDMIIGSQHSVNGLDIYEGSLYNNKTKDEVFTDYFKDILKSVHTHNYINTLAHIDYICRYNPYDDKEIYVNEYYDYLKEIFNFCIENDIAIEVNTRRFNNKSCLPNLKNIYKLYKDLGGNFVTIGSDSHNAHSIGSNFDIASDFCNALNLKPVYFKNRKIQYL